jgi:hypothetical protein
MHIGTPVRMDNNEIENASQITEEFLAEPRPGGFIPIVCLGDIALRKWREAELPTHRGRRRAFS